MFNETLEKLGAASRAKVDLFNESVFKYFLLSVMAGVYVGFGSILVYNLAAPFNEAGSPATKLIMAITFSIALCLVLFAGAELFTGNTMTLTVGLLRKNIGFSETCKCLLVCFIGNLAGSVLAAAAGVCAGLFETESVVGFVTRVALNKMTLPFEQLFIRAILCNMLVCLATWMAYRLKDETAKALMIILCILTFYASGFEHSIANMSTLAIALFIPHGPEVSMAGYLYSIVVSGIGNLIGGAVFIGAFYYYVSLGKR